MQLVELSFVDECHAITSASRRVVKGSEDPSNWKVGKGGLNWKLKQIELKSGRRDFGNPYGAEGAGLALGKPYEAGNK